MDSGIGNSLYCVYSHRSPVPVPNRLDTFGPAPSFCPVLLMTASTRPLRK